MTKQYFVTTSDPIRQAEWMHIFHTDVLPIKGPQATMSPCRSLAYRLDAARLTWGQRVRLIGRMCRKHRLSYDEAVQMVTEGYPIYAENCEVIEQEQCAPAFSLVHHAHETITAMLTPRLCQVGAVGAMC